MSRIMSVVVAAVLLLIVYSWYPFTLVNLFVIIIIIIKIMISFNLLIMGKLWLRHKLMVLPNFHIVKGRWWWPVRNLVHILWQDPLLPFSFGLCMRFHQSRQWSSCGHHIPKQHGCRVICRSVSRHELRSIYGHGTFPIRWLRQQLPQRSWTGRLRVWTHQMSHQHHRTVGYQRCRI